MDTDCAVAEVGGVELKDSFNLSFGRKGVEMGLGCGGLRVRDGAGVSA